jgi:hypothetical protein
MSGASDYFLIIGAVAVVICTLLLWRMSVEVNAVLPGRVSLAVRKDWSEARRLHRNCFPTFPANATRIASYLMAAVGWVAFIIAIILKVK